MKKVFIYALDTAILFVLVWAFLLRGLTREFWYFAGVGLLAVGAVAILFVIKHRADKRIQAQVSAELEKKRLEATRIEQARQERIAAEREARRPLCVHCGKASEPRHQHRRTDGSADMRFRVNPLLCNRCSQPYDVVRPWRLEKAAQQPPS